MSRLRSLSNSAAVTSFVVVLVLYKILIHEHDDEMNQIRSHAYAPAVTG